MNTYNFNIKFFIAVIALFSLIVSCQKTLDINEDPNTSASATPAVVLPAAQLNLEVTISRWNFLGCMWGQYWAGGPGVGTNAMEKYNMNGTDNNTAWTQAYAGTLADLTYLIDSDQPVYSGMAKIMSAYLYQMLTDLHGAVPFSEAIKGAIEKGSILTPKYDDDTMIYRSLIPMIDEGIAEINLGGDAPTTNDLIFEGDLSKWETFANSLKVKILTRAGKYAEAKTLVESGITLLNTTTSYSLSGIAINSASIRPSGSGKNTNPLYAQFAGGSLGMFYLAAEASITRLGTLSDPRINTLYTKPTGLPHRGIATGNVNLDPQYELVGTETAAQARAKYSGAGIPYASNAPVFFISTWEMNFILAEIYVRNNDFVTAEMYFDEAVIQSFASLSTSGSSSYLSSLGFSTLSKDDMLNTIAEQKWISMNGFQMIEGWIETVRFDRPANTLFTTGIAASSIPRFVTPIFTDPIQNTLGSRNYPSSFVYPTQEVSNNPNTPAGRTITDKRFWDI